VTGIEKLQEIKSLAATYLTKDDTVRAVAEGSLQQVADVTAEGRSVAGAPQRTRLS